MDVSALFIEIVGLYAKHGWQLRRVLLRPEARARLDQYFAAQNVSPTDAPIDALWFSRPSHSAREAWELRALSENPYALFETFEADEAAEDREDVLKEMENRMREYLTSNRTA